MTHVRKLSLCFAIALLPACGTIGDYELDFEFSELTVKECQDNLGAGNPFDDKDNGVVCPALDPATLKDTDCAGLDAKTPWHPKWDPKLPVCFGFQGDINRINDPKWAKPAANPPPTKCNYLSLGSVYCYCNNYKYSMCAIAQKLPGMAKGKPAGTSQILPVTDPNPLKPLPPGEDCLFMQYCSNWPAGVTVGMPFSCTIKGKPGY
jgi:hypothetical protein